MTREVRTDAPDAPDARVLALDVGAYGHKGSISAMFWYRQGGHLHAHASDLLPPEATVRDQLDVLEGLAESYPEYWRVSPVVVIGVTVLSGEGRREVRQHLADWYNPPTRRRLVAVGDYAGEQSGGRGLVPRKKLRDMIAQRLTAHTLHLTSTQQEAVSLYSGRRARPVHDADIDGWRHDDTDAIALPVALSCLAARSLLPPPMPTAEQRWRQKDRLVRAWQIEMGLSEQEAHEQAHRHGHPRAFQATTTSVSMAMPSPDVPALNLPVKGA
ncbi:hypothetical protein FB384_004913 [Prauserella sediminis]|uniref:Uncharacterized protein n=1 Tax=Prauserella sediminis TaxID=577680 RepID=A0A839XX74_9PSEU|nr:hypothetical protein [Prauserella sediminis]MBB3665954.1 hypothetical protein [Prauserella sediminis]